MRLKIVIDFLYFKSAISCLLKTIYKYLTNIRKETSKLKEKTPPKKTFFFHFQKKIISKILLSTALYSGKVLVRFCVAFGLLSTAKIKFFSRKQMPNQKFRLLKLSFSRKQMPNQKFALKKLVCYNCKRYFLSDFNKLKILSINLINADKTNKTYLDSDLIIPSDFKYVSVSAQIQPLQVRRNQQQKIKTLQKNIFRFLEFIILVFLQKYGSRNVLYYLHNLLIEFVVFDKKNECEVRLTWCRFYSRREENNDK